MSMSINSFVKYVINELKKHDNIFEMKCDTKFRRKISSSKLNRLDNILYKNGISKKYKFICEKHNRGYVLKLDSHYNESIDLFMSLNFKSYVVSFIKHPAVFFRVRLAKEEEFFTIIPMEFNRLKKIVKKSLGRNYGYGVSLDNKSKYYVFHFRLNDIVYRVFAEV